MAKATLKKKKTLFTSKVYLNLRGEKLLKCCIWSMAWFSALTWTLQKVDQKHAVSFQIRYWIRMEKISGTDRVVNTRKEVLHTVKEERNILGRIKRKEANWIGHILRRN